MVIKIPSPLCGPLVALTLAAAASSACAQSPLDRAFAFADANHDGVVTRAEFQASRSARFKALDLNQDGYLSREDLPAGLGLLRRTPARLQVLLEKFDADHDGKVSLSEFIAGSMALFDRADVNHDGVLTRTEAAAAADAFRSVSGR